MAASAARERREEFWLVRTRGGNTGGREPEWKTAGASSGFRAGKGAWQGGPGLCEGGGARERSPEGQPREMRWIMEVADHHGRFRRPQLLYRARHRGRAPGPRHRDQAASAAALLPARVSAGSPSATGATDGRRHCQIEREWTGRLAGIHAAVRRADRWGSRWRARVVLAGAPGTPRARLGRIRRHEGDLDMAPVKPFGWSRTEHCDAPSTAHGILIAPDRAPFGLLRAEAWTRPSFRTFEDATGRHGFCKTQ